MSLRQKLLAAIAAAACIGALLAIDAFWLEPDSLRVTQYEVPLLHCPPPLAGLRIAVITDLHAGAPFIDLAKIRRVVEMSNAEHPDLVLLTGDIYVNSVIGGHPLPQDQVVALLAELRARLGVYYVFGNHEHNTDMGHLRALMADTPIQVMDNAVRRIEVNGHPLWLIGLADFVSDQPDITGTMAKITDDGPIIMFTHGPDLFPMIPKRVNLVVAGHTHGGQIRLPILGRGRTPSAYGRKRFAAGHVVEQTDLFVSTGIGTSHIPVRFRVPPEISLLTLSQAETGTASP